MWRVHRPAWPTAFTSARLNCCSPASGGVNRYPRSPASHIRTRLVAGVVVGVVAGVVEGVEAGVVAGSVACIAAVVVAVSPP